MSEAQGCSPPSAAGLLEPYGVRVLLQPLVRPLETVPFLKALLEELASSCTAAGAAPIGHIKCVLHTDLGPLAANLTSVRSGAAVRGDGAGAVAPGDEAQLDLAVLVYALPADTIDKLVERALGGLLSAAGASWSKSVSVHSRKS